MSRQQRELATSISTDGGHCLAVGSDGNVYAWGNNVEGQLGDGTAGAPHPTPEKIAMPTADAVTSVTAGAGRSFAINSAGVLYAWGADNYGQLGNGGTTNSVASPVAVQLAAGITATAVIGGDNFTLALGSDGDIYAWGSNASGAFGDGKVSSTPTSTPEHVGKIGGHSVAALAAGEFFADALTDVGTVYAWGPDNGQLGDGTPTNTTKPTPTQLTLPAGPATAIAAGSQFGFAISGASAPSFIAADPPTTVAAGAQFDYRFVAGGFPAPSYALSVGAPSWLSIDPASGQLSGTVPNGAGSFTFSVTASNDAGVATAGPFTVVVAGSSVSVSGTVITSDGTGISGVEIDVCDTRGVCTSALSGSGGAFSAAALPGATVTATAYPPSGSGLLPGGTAQREVPDGGLQNVRLELQGPATIDGLNFPTGQLSAAGSTPVFSWTTPAGMHVQGCPGGLATVGEVVRVNGTGPWIYEVYPLTETPFGSGVYTGRLPAQYPNHGPALITPSVTCEPPLTAPTADGPQMIASTNAPMMASRAAAARPAVTPADVDTNGLLSNLFQSFGPLLNPFFPRARAAIDEAIAQVNPSCKTNQDALVSLIIADLAPVTGAVVGGVLPSAETIALALGVESGPGEVLIAALTAVAVKEMVGKMMRDLVTAAVQARLGDCDPPIKPDALIDPSGTVLDTHGNPVSGVTATILRADTSSGPFAPVDVTQPGIAPATNPETTNVDGTFHWDVRAGYYEISAAKSGCTDPVSGGQRALIGPYPVPPPQVGLTITLACPDEPAAPIPVIDALGTQAGPPAGGTQVTITGTGFAPSAAVAFGATAAGTMTYLSPNELLATSPGGTGTVRISVTTAGGTSGESAADHFSYGTTPTVSGLSVSSGPYTGGTQVTVTGTGFTGATIVGFGGTPGTDVQVQSDTQLTATSPVQLPGPADVSVTTPIGTSTTNAADVFTFTPPPPPPPPTCTDAQASTRSGTAITVQLSCTGDEITFDQPTAPAHGSLSGLDSSAGTVSYTPDTGFAGTDTFTYAAHNSGGSSLPATVTITVTRPSTTTLAASAKKAYAGAPVTFSASVTPGPDSGLVAFTDNGTAVSGCQSVPVDSSGTASCSTYFLSAGSHAVVATFGGSTFESPSTSLRVTVAVTGSCRTGRIGRLILTARMATCLGPTAVVTGPVTVVMGSVLFVHGADLRSLVDIGGGQLVVCSAHVTGPLEMLVSRGPIEVGGATGCGPNVVTGSVNVSANFGAVSVVGNTIGGSLIVELNRGPVLVSGNVVHGRTWIQTGRVWAD